jgi:hypothetical protein
VPADEYWMEITYEIVSTTTTEADGHLFLNVNDTFNAQMGGIAVVIDGGVPKFTGTWYAPPGPVATPIGTEHTFTQAHTLAAESSADDGNALTFNPAPLGGYVAAMAGRFAEFFHFGLFGGAFGPPYPRAYLDTWKIGSAPGLADYLDWNALNDGFGPLTPLAGGVGLEPPGRVLVGGPSGGMVQFDFAAPWPPVLPAWEYPVSFTVGGRRVALDHFFFAPDELTHAYAVLPDLALSEGCRIEFGTYGMDGLPRVVDSTRDGVLAVERFDVDEDAPD